jgi:hypothetical protein
MEFALVLGALITTLTETFEFTPSCISISFKSLSATYTMASFKKQLKPTE